MAFLNCKAFPHFFDENIFNLIRLIPGSTLPTSSSCTSATTSTGAGKLSGSGRRLPRLFLHEISSDKFCLRDLALWVFGIHILVTTSLSPCPCHHVLVTMPLSPCPCHHVPVTMSLSPYPCRHILVAIFLSPYLCHHNSVVTTPMYQRSRSTYFFDKM
jgi:hypothetical protein